MRMQAFFITFGLHIFTPGTDAFKLFSNGL